MIPLLRSARAGHRLDGCSHRLRYGQIDSALPTYPIRHFVSTENAGRGYTRAIGGKSYVERVLRVRLLRSIDSCSNEDSDIKHPVRQLFLPSSRIANLPLDLFKEDVYALYRDDVQGAPRLRAGAQYDGDPTLFNCAGRFFLRLIAS